MIHLPEKARRASGGGKSLRPLSRRRTRTEHGQGAAGDLSRRGRRLPRRNGRGAPGPGGARRGSGNSPHHFSSCSQPQGLCGIFWLRGPGSGGTCHGKRPGGRSPGNSGVLPRPGGAPAPCHGFPAPHGGPPREHGDHGPHAGARRPRPWAGHRDGGRSGGKPRRPFSHRPGPLPGETPLRAGSGAPHRTLSAGPFSGSVSQTPGPGRDGPGAGRRRSGARGPFRPLAGRSALRRRSPGARTGFAPGHPPGVAQGTHASLRPRSPRPRHAPGSRAFPKLRSPLRARSWHR